MKKGNFIFGVFFLLLVSTNIYANEKLTWGLKSKNFKKKFEAEKIYTNDICEIIYLPKDSIFENEYDEYLLFSNKDGLIARLQNTEELFDELEKNKYDKVEENLGYYTEKQKYFKPFPDEFSFEVISLLQNRDDYIGSERYQCNEWGHDFESYNVINYCGKGFIKKIYSLFKTEEIIPIRKAKYKDFLVREEIIKVIRSFIDYLDYNRKIDYENQYRKNPGPFGLYWGMNENVMNQFGSIDKYKKIGDGFDIDEYKNFFFYDSGFITTYTIKPEKSNDRIGSYTALFDDEHNLFQIVCVNYATLVTDTKILDIQSKETQDNFEEMKSIISKNYGEGRTITKRGEKCVRWGTSSEQQIELLQNSYLEKTWSGQTGNVSYVWLIYSSPNYNTTIDKFKKTIEEREQKIKQEKEEKDKIQNSYF